MKHKIIKTLALAALVACGSGLAFATTQSASITIAATATVQQSELLAQSGTATLDFGIIILAASFSGTQIEVVDPSSATTPSQLSVAIQNTPTVSAADVTVNASTGATVTLGYADGNDSFTSYILDGTQSGDSGSRSSVFISNLTFSNAGTCTVASTATSCDIYVGGTLNIKPAAVADSYTGTINLEASSTS